MNKAVRILVGLLLSVFFLWLVLHNFDLAVLRRTLREASFAWAVPAGILFIFSHLMRSVRWSVLLSPLARITPFRLFPAVISGLFANNVLPARGGEVVKAFAAHRLTGIKTVSCFGSVVAERIADMVGLGFLALLAAQLLPADAIRAGRLSTLLIVGVGVVVIALFAGRTFLRRPRGEGRLAKIALFVNHLIAGITALRSPVKIMSVLLLTLFIWSIEVVQIYLFSRAFQLDLSLLQSAALIFGICLGAMLPAAPGFVGTYEFFGQRTLVLMGFPEDQALSFVLVLHFFQYALMALLGIPCILKIGFGRSDLQAALSGKPA